jgi:anti-anti-sigma factor
MNFDLENNGTSVTLRLKERKLDSTVSPVLKGEFLLICKPKVEKLNVDLDTVEFCDSSGLSALLIADRKMKEHGGKVVLRNVHKNVNNLIKISMLDRVFEIHEAHHPVKH